MKNTFIPGFIFILISLFYYLFWDSISYIALLIFLYGIILLLLGFIFKRYKNVVRSWFLILTFSLPFLVILPSIFWQNRSFAQTVILPVDYNGLVIIQYLDENREGHQNQIRPIVVGMDGIGKADYHRENFTLDGMDIILQTSKMKEVMKLNIVHFINYPQQDSLKVNAFLASDLGDILSLVICKNNDAGRYFSESSTPVLKKHYQDKLNNFLISKNNRYE